MRFNMSTRAEQSKMKWSAQPQNGLRTENINRLEEQFIVL